MNGALRLDVRATVMRSFETRDDQEGQTRIDGYGMTSIGLAAGFRPANIRAHPRRGLRA